MRSRKQLRTWLVVAIVLTVATGLGELIYILGAVGALGGEHHSQSRGALIVLAIIFLGLFIACVQWLRRLEHALHGDAPVAKSFVGETPHGHAARAARRRFRARRYSPRSNLWSAVLFAAVTIGCLIGAISSHAQAARSSETQHHGIETLGMTTAVDNNASCGKSSCDYSAAVTVQLVNSVDGQTTTVAHLPYETTLSAHEPVQVLVDPNDPSYAEFPGVPFKKSSEWVGLLVLGLVMLAVTAFFGRQWWRTSGHGRRHRAGENESIVFS